MVYDQDNENLHLAQAEDCGEHIIPIGSGVDAVPSSTGLCSGPAGTVARTSLTGIAKSTMHMPTATSASRGRMSASMETGTAVMTGTPTKPSGETASATATDSTPVQVNVMARETSNPMAAFGLAAAAAVLLV